MILICRQLDQEEADYEETTYEEKIWQAYTDGFTLHDLSGVHDAGIFTGGGGRRRCGSGRAA